MSWVSRKCAFFFSAISKENHDAMKTMERLCFSSSGALSSKAIIKCLVRHFSRHRLPRSLKADNAAHLVSKEMEAFLTEHGVEHRRVIPLWPHANGEVERQKRTLLTELWIAQTKRKDWKKTLFKFLLAYRSTPHSITGVSPAKLIFNREIKTKLPEYEDYAEGDEVSTSEVRDTNAQRKQNYVDNPNKRAHDSDIEEGDKVMLKCDKENKLSSNYDPDPDPYRVLARKGDMLIVERYTLYKRNIAHMKHFIQLEMSEMSVETQLREDMGFLQPTWKFDRVEQ